MSDFLPPVVLRLAADISEYTEKLALASAQLEAFTQGAGEKVEAATRTIGAEGEEAGRRYSSGLPAHVSEGAERAVGNVEGRLRDARGRFSKQGEEHGRAHGEGFLGGIRNAFGAVFSFLGQAGSQIGTVLGGAGRAAGMGLSVLSSVAFPALIAAAAQTLPALAAVAGALAGSIPAAASVAAGALATVFLGFHGLAGAIHSVFAPAATDGGGAVSSLNQIANAEWNLKQAQQQVIQTQQALNQARVAAIQNIKDLALAMSGAKLSVEEAQLAVKDADLAWRQAFATGNQDQIYRTNLALRQAQQNLAEAQNSADKTAAQKEDADARGVEGSQGVQSALQAQANAAHSLEQAQQALAQAMKGSGGAAGGVADALAKLAPSARAVVEEIKRLAPAFHDIQQTVQQHMFVGLAEDLDHLAHNVLPGAKVGLTAMADQFNLLFRGIAQGLASPAFSGAMTTVFSSFTTVFHQFAELAPAGIAAFSNLAKASTPFMQALGGGAATGLGKMLDGINKLAANGGLEKFFATATALLTPLGGLLKDLGSIIGSVFGAISSAGGPALGVLGELVHQLAEFFKSADGSSALKAIFATLAPLLKLLGDVIAEVLPILGSLLTALGPALQPIIAALGPLLHPVIQLIGKIAEALVPIIVALSPAITAVLVALTPLLDMLGGALGDVIMALAPIIAQLATVLGQILAQALTALWPLFQALLPPIVQLVQALLPALVPIIQLVAKVFDLLMPILTPLISIITALLVPILQILTPIIAAVAPVIQLVADALVWIITPIADFIAWLVKGLSEASTWKAIGHWFMDLWNTISDAFMKGVHWVAQKWDEMVNLTKSIPKRIVEAIGNFNSLLIDKGKDLVYGLWNGIVGMSSWLKDKIIGWAKAVIPGPIADALGIRSPSKVAEDLARWVPLGLAQGMDDGTSHVIAASGRLASAMVPSIGDLPVGVTGLPVLGGDGASLAAPGGGGGASLPPIDITIPVEIGGQTMQVLHVQLIPVAQQYKRRTGTTGLS